MMEDGDDRSVCSICLRVKGPATMSEAELQQGILDALAAGGWLYHSIRRSDLAIQQGMSGWPDVVALHPQRRETFVAELKSATGRLDPLQTLWLDTFRECGYRVHVITPDDYDDTVRWLVGHRLVEAGR
jgi:hypothetical protein